MLSPLSLKQSLSRRLSNAPTLLQVCLVVAGLGFPFAFNSLQASTAAGSDHSRTLAAAIPVLSDDDALPAAAPDTSSTDEPLSPRMRAALDYVAQRYRVSAEALDPIFQAVQSTSQELSLDPLLIVAVIGVESRFNPFSQSVMGAQGLMQVIPRFHQDKLPANAGKTPLLDPVTNIRVGALALDEAIRRHGGLREGLQQFAGATRDEEQAYATKVMVEKQRLETAINRSTGRG